MPRTFLHSWSVVASVGIAFALTTAVLLAQGRNPAASPRGATLPHPVLDVKEFMDVFNKPWYEDLRKDLAKRPNGDEAWADIENDALRMTEIPNLIVLREVPRSAVPTVQQHAAELQQSALALSKAAKARDYDGARNAWKTAVQSCNAYHQALAPQKAPQLKM